MRRQKAELLLVLLAAIDPLPGKLLTMVAG
jgi:hypothetical protein